MIGHSKSNHLGAQRTFNQHQRDVLYVLSMYSSRDRSAYTESVCVCVCVCVFSLTNSKETFSTYSLYIRVAIEAHVSSVCVCVCVCSA